MNKADCKPGLVLEYNKGDSATEALDRRVLIVKIRHDADGADPCSEVALISLGRKRTLPFVLKWEDLSAQISSGSLHVTSAHPEMLKVRSLNDVPRWRRSKFSKKLSSNKALIQPILDLGWGAFIESVRGAEVRAIAAGKFSGKSCSASWIRTLLIAYWRTGDNDFALGPDYTRCGAPTRAERRRRALEGKVALVEPWRPGPKIRIVRVLETDSASPPPSNTRGRGGCAISPAAELLIQKLIARYLNDPANKAILLIASRRWKGLPWEAIKNDVTFGLRDYPEHAALRPSRRQIAYIGKNSTDALAVREKVFGTRETDLNNRAESGDYRDVSQFPGQRYEIDISEMDIHLVDDIASLNIGRVFVIYTVDRFTGMIAGAYVTTDEPDFAHVARALHCAYANKQEWCRSIGLEIGPEDWPCEGKCEEVVADNAQLATKDGLQIAEYMTDLGLARSYRGDDKPQVETSFMLTEHGLVHGFSYGVSKGPNERARENPTKAACISVGLFTRELVRWVVYVANHRALPTARSLPSEFIKTRKNTTPYEFWRWSVKNIGGPLKAYVPALMMPRLLKRTRAKMTNQGLVLEGFAELRFDREDDELFQRNKRQATLAGCTEVEVYYDELTTRQIYIAPVDSNEAPISCPLSHLSRDYAEKTFKEVRLARDFRAGIDLATRDAAAERKSIQLKAQRAAANSDLNKVKNNYGGLKQRNSVANGIDIEVVRADQAKSDNLAQTDAIHGPASSADQAPADKKSSEHPSPPVRPSLYE